MPMFVEWQTLTDSDIHAVAALAERCLAVDGGLPATASPAFLQRRYLGDRVVAVGAPRGGRRLIASGAVRPGDGGSAIVGQVDPGHRGNGLGGALLDRLLAEARHRGERVRVETESLTAEADTLFRSRGLRQVFAEDVLRRDLRVPLPAAQLPAGVAVREWTGTNRGDFFAAYRGSFADRPGKPDWSQRDWVDWTVDDEFLPACSLVARDAAGTPVGFITCADGFLIQTGVVPAWRRRGLSRALAVIALERMRANAISEVFLDVNVNNPGSSALFGGLGFTFVTRRARYQREGAAHDL